uniref:Protein kinase domain-containing protein n=1 Tax=Amphora coffeiformis TaxID=265554 RepID=A0A6S8P934_9STRA
MRYRCFLLLACWQLGESFTFLFPSHSDKGKLVRRQRPLFERYADDINHGYGGYAIDQNDVSLSQRSSTSSYMHTAPTSAQQQDPATVLGNKYVLKDEGTVSPSGKSTLFKATTINRNDPPSGNDCRSSKSHDDDTKAERQCVLIKFSENIEALKREADNYERVAAGSTGARDLFVRVHDFYEPHEDSHQNGGSSDNDQKPVSHQAALVMERGSQDLRDFLQQHGPLRGDALRKAVASTARTVKAYHDQDMVWTELKSRNFVVVDDENKPSSSNNDLGEKSIKAIDLESAVPRGEAPIDWSPEAIPPEFATPFLCGQEKGQRMQKGFDIFSLGLLWYELATARGYWKNRFDEEKPCHVRIATELRAADSMCLDHEEAQQIEPPLKDLIAQCLRMEPSERPSVNEILDHPYVANTAIA